MQAKQINFLKFLKDSPRFAVPIYQRTYSWTTQQCRQLWNDILRTGREPGDNAHFVGSIVYIMEDEFQVASHTPLFVIDGQQRLTTVLLILEALARHIGDQEPVPGFSAKRLREYYLLNHLEKDEQRFKLSLTQTDKETFLSLMEGGPQAPANASVRVKDNFAFFQENIANLGNDLAAFCRGLAGLVIVDISLHHGKDNPQLIFESMNSTGLDLSQADLIRNFVLMGLDYDLQEKIYTEQWRPMEIEFGQEAYGKHFDAFMRHYLTLKMHEIPKISQVYKRFKEYANSAKIKENGVEALVADIRAYSGHYCAMALGKEQNKALASAFADFVKLKAEIAFPFLLELYGDYASGSLSAEDFERAVRLVESYVLRRAICEIPTNSMNKTFANFGRVLKKERYLESIQAHFLLLPTYRRFPADDEFRKQIKERNIYTFRSRTYLLGKLENHGHKEFANINEYSIEHILPQNKNLSPEWKEMLGENWQEVQKTWLHTLGNLTLTGYNSEYSDRSFLEKRDMKNGFGQSKLYLNRDLGSLDVWNEQAIQNRAAELADTAVKIWDAPRLDDATLATYKREEEQSSVHTIEKDHPYLAAGSAMRPLFDEFDREVRAFDENVKQEVLMHYISYKSDSSIVSVIPQAKALQLTINISHAEISDPAGMAEYVSGRGHLGIGDTRAYLRNEEDLRYVIGLVRQAFEKQLGDPGPFDDEVGDEKIET
ncbi:MAG: DUF262 and DUF1524 domain-containing protein [Gammaproteobacteria bacterium]|nr:DUF262 and DUF1524 domain-containing protein [Gammaproteobacteria bacterium]CAJ2376216.1 MAG: conserved hypothetical protein [Arenicellales bacterium IbO2]MDA7962308.1 DUF262 and DUF1524 domain-containing protein [Gammaproteobacteria bacterium]MDA7969193.1 DUF262 and DUF1524 domain-containing protein [Gammaproteobacteria bacterium]MDA7995602.1 DUF262 and DUF1524 domain-containing protein [Gammaproteobacteria bacterium]